MAQGYVVIWPISRSRFNSILMANAAYAGTYTFKFQMHLHFYLAIAKHKIRQPSSQTGTLQVPEAMCFPPEN